MAPRLDLDSLQLSDEDRARVESVIAENDRLQRKDRDAAVETEIARVSALGLSDQNGFLKNYRRLLLADDGETAAVLLSEDGTRQEELTVTDALKQLIGALPQKDGKIVLSEQHLVEDDHGRADDASDEDKEETHDEKVKDARKRLGFS